MRIKAKNPKLVSVIGEFMKVYLPCVKKRDDDTVASYRYSLNLYMTYLEQTLGITLATIDASDFSQKNILDFLSWLKSDRGNVATTINHRLSDIRNFSRYLLKKKMIAPEDYEEIREINDVRDDRVTDFTWLSVEDVKDILQSVAENRDAVRDRFLLSLLYESGARINEILSLRHSDMKPTNDGEVDIHFFGKGNKHRITPLSEEIWKQYNSYCESGYHLTKNPEDLVFYSYRNGQKNKMSSDNVSRILLGCEEKVRTKNPELIHLHSHIFRRTRAMHLYQAGMPLPTISEWLGHSNIETTRFYAKVTEEMKRDALHKLSESADSVFKDDTAFKYADDEDMLKRLCGLK